MGNLFNKYYLSEFINAYRKQLYEDIDRLDITESSNTDSIIERLIDKATIEPIEIQEPRPSEPRETTRQRKNHWGESYNQKVYEIYVRIPFTGNKDLFFCMPLTSTVVYLEKGVSINANSIDATIVFEELDANKFNSLVSQIIGALKTNLPRIYSEIKPWNDNLESYIWQALEQRKVPLPGYKYDFSGFIVEFRNNTLPKIDGVNDGVNDGVIKIIDDGVDSGVIDNLKEDIKNEIVTMISLIANNEGINTNSIVDKLGSKSKPTIERYLKVVRKLEIIEYRGASKTGGYFLTQKAKEVF